MINELNPQALDQLAPFAINDLLPERPALIGEFSPAYEAFREATLEDLSPATRYEYIQAQQLVDLNWAILQAKASADIELSTSTEGLVRSRLHAKLEGDFERGFLQLLKAFVEGGGDEDDFEDPMEWDAVGPRVEGIVEGLKSKDGQARGQANAEAVALGIDPRLVLSAQLLNNAGYRRHSEKLPDLEKRARLLSAEYRAVQNARPIDVVAAAGG
jgi:hypothetical protein